MIVTDTNLEPAMRVLRIANEIAFDLETTGLSPDRDTICGVALAVRVGDGNTNGDYVSFYLPCGHGEGDNLSLPQIVEVLKELFAREDRTWLTWNGKFDYQWTLELGIPLPKITLDAQLAAHLLDENVYSFGLKQQGARLLGADARDEEEGLMDEIKARGLKGKGQMWKLPAKLVAPYAEMDVILTFRLYRLFDRPLRYWKLYNLWLEVCEYMRVVLYIEREGMALDLSLIDEKIVQAEQGMKETQAALKQYFGFDLNPNSPKQVLTLMRTLEPTLMKTDKEALTPLAAKHPIVDQILLYREWSKVSGVYYQPFRELSTNGIIHPNLNMLGTVTGRFSCAEPNLQAIPRKAEDAHGLRPRSYIKSVFVSRPGFVMIQADYKQAEVYLGAHYAKAKRLIAMLQAGVDVHTATSKELNIPRFAAKRLNFSMQYGIGADALAGDLGVSVEEASDYLDKYNTMHPEMKQLYFNQGRMGKEQGFIRLFTDRTRRYNDPHTAQKMNVRYSPAHKASSNLIQGGVGEIMRISSMKMAREIPEFRQRLHVHDSVMGEVPVGHVHEICREVIRCMTEHTKIFTVPLSVDLEVGTRWFDMVPLSEYKE